MSKKNKGRSKIFEDAGPASNGQDAKPEEASVLDEAPISDSPAEQDSLAPDVSKESMVESVPDDPKQMAELDGKLSQISQLTAELNVARQKIAELEKKIDSLQADNDQLVMKLAEASAKAAERIQIPLQVQLPSGKAAKVIGKTDSMPASKRVNYIHTNYSNNGYGTWH